MLSKKCKYAIHALVYLAERYQQGPVHIQDIADEQHIPKKFLEAWINNQQTQELAE